MLEDRVEKHVRTGSDTSPRSTAHPRNLVIDLLAIFRMLTAPRLLKLWMCAPVTAR
jgi:hypothetical protein